MSMSRASHPAPLFATMVRLSIPLKIRNRNEAVLFVGSTAEGNMQSGDDADQGKPVTAEPDRDYCRKPDT